MYSEAEIICAYLSLLGLAFIIVVISKYSDRRKYNKAKKL